MPEPYGLADPGAQPGPTGPARSPARRDATSAVLWVVLAAGVELNLVSSAVGGMAVILDVVTGLATVACGVALYTRHRERQGRSRA